ncbi:MAG: tetratricopeptide repeat protein [Candidatus Marinimicrobia bacterium]|jgi:tetratricopeptide (TPR) repeat protein|nr:tetratricopeptide repeat protein [Candidatus Neomarinimicrobiota bacterium]MDP6611926.1 tetratricopeptide repeat protein [Candidatus Neomarinimicrobiota bacterium]|tara:strand:+ start:10749 stop:12056 length:1308 start_codon:yes stop_codon:yes gene_type:complete
MLKKLSLITFLIGIVFAQSPEELFKSAQASLEAGQVDEAEAGFNATLQADPTFAPAYLGLAEVAMHKGDLKAAGDKLKEAIEVEPENQEFRDKFEQMNELNTLMSKGRRSMKNGEADDAFESFRIAYEKFPNYPESVFNMGLVHFRKKEYAEAVVYFHQTMNINPYHKTALAAIKNVAKNYFNSGNQSYKRGDLEGALGSYEKVLEVDATFYQALYQIGVIQSKMGNKDRAIQSYEKALEVNPQFYKGYFALGLAKNGLNDTEGALAALEAAVDIHPGYDKAYGAMGDIYINIKNNEKAKQVLNLAVTVNPNYAKGYASLGTIYSEEKNWEQAKDNLVMATTLNERDAMSFFRLAGIYNAMGDCSGAKDAARKSTELKNRFGGGWFELGIAEWCDGKGNKTGALNAFEKARNDRAWRKMAEYEMDKVKNPQKYEK